MVTLSLLVGILLEIYWCLFLSLDPSILPLLHLNPPTLISLRCCPLGTPAGVGPVKAGDVITGGLVEKADDGSEKVLSTISFDVINRPSKAKL